MPLPRDEPNRNRSPFMRRYILFAERISLILGSALVLVAGIAWVDGVAHSRWTVTEFEQLSSSAVSSANQATWSEQRKAAYQRSLQQDAGSTLAVLRIPSAAIEVPVFDSTDKIALNRGSGHVEGTARPGEAGNIAIAGHRDGFFRGLKDIEVGADIEVLTLQGRRVFRVSELRVVDPLDVSVLDSTDATMLTLITCYPFYYVGSAPERFIVRAVLSDSK